MANTYLVRVKGKRPTPYEAKTGTVRRDELIDNSMPRTMTVVVLWDGEKEEERVSRDAIEMIA
jgi:hypothetical protein